MPKKQGWGVGAVCVRFGMRVGKWRDARPRDRLEREAYCTREERSRVVGRVCGVGPGSREQGAGPDRSNACSRVHAWSTRR